MDLRRVSIGLLIGMFFVPGAVFAAGLSSSAPKQSYAVGESFALTVSVDAGIEAINTIGGKLLVPSEFFDVVDIRYGNSIVTLWVEKPTYAKAAGIISFTGGVPGGFTGGKGPLLTLGLRAKKAGIATVSFSDVSILKNDGQGGSLTGLVNSGSSFTITPPRPVPPSDEREVVPQAPAAVYEPPVDTAPPEPFFPLVSRHTSVADNAYFVSFSAVDKDSGVERYEVQEIPRYLPIEPTAWIAATSPHVLSYQAWSSVVRVRAYDGAGNMQESYTTKPFAPVLVTIAWVASICVAVLLSTHRPKNSRPARKKAVK